MRVWLRRGLAGAGGVILVVVLVAGVMAWTPPAPPVDEDAIRAETARYSARIIRDAYGTPHIHGATDADAAFGLAWAHAEDDWATIQSILVASRGDLARHEGAAGAQTDYIVRLLRIQETVEARYERDLPVEARAIAEAYAAGLNAWAVENGAAVWPGVLPATGRDVIAGFVLRTPFMYGLDSDIAELFRDERARTISIGDAETAFLAIEGPNPHLGSNAMAVAPHRSADGATRLMINSHQPFTGPVAWYEARLTSDEGWDAAGGTFPGAPLILHGHNARIGWAMTVNAPDLADIYVLDIDPDNSDRYRLDGEWRDLERATARIRVKLFGPFSWVFERELLWSTHGPVLRRPHGTYAIRYSGMDEVRGLEQWRRMNRAEGLEDWLAAMEMRAITSLNVVYADADGHIGYLYNARMPVRREGPDWRQYLPGDRSDLIWADIEPFSALPFLLDPPAGYVVNANNPPFRATAPADDLRREDFPAAFGIETQDTNRGLRLLALLDADPAISREALDAYKFDDAYAPDSAVGRLRDALLAMDFSGDAALSEAQAALAAWDLRTDRDNRHAALGVLTAIKCVGNRHGDAPFLCDPEEALRASTADLMAHHGRLDPRWGDINRLVRGDMDLPLDGGPDIARAVYCGCDALGPDGRFTAVAGDTYIMAVEWDGEGRVSSRAIHQFGSATLDESSPHYADQAMLFARRELRELPLARNVLLNEATADYHVGGRTE